MATYIYKHEKILRQMKIWHRCTPDEQARFHACTTEIQVDNMMRALRERYL